MRGEKKGKEVVWRKDKGGGGGGGRGGRSEPRATSLPYKPHPLVTIPSHTF